MFLSPHSCGRWFRLLLLLALGGGPISAAPVTDSYTLRPGWNAIYLRVVPADPSCAAVFSHPAIRQVWTPGGRGTDVQFILDLNEPAFNPDGGRRFVPPSRPDAVVTDLFRVLGNTAYLVEVGGAEEITLTVTGEPSLRDFAWDAGRFNLYGPRLDAAASVSLGDYFSASAAHAGQPVYGLDADGRWQELAANTVAVPGRAYWVKTPEGTDYQGPLTVTSPTNDGIVFAGEVVRSQVEIRNEGAVPVSITVSATGGLPLLREAFDPVAKTTWQSFSETTLSIEAGATRVVNLGLRRAQLGSVLEGNLVVKGGGTETILPIRVQDETAPLSSALIGKPSASNVLKNAGTNPRAGLWLGQALVDQVSYVNDDNPSRRTEPVGTSQPFPLRILVHVSDEGNYTLLGQVTVMKKTDGDDQRFVLISDDDLIDDFDGATLVDGRDFAFRTSALGFGSGRSDSAMTGSFDTGLAATLTIAVDDPLHPYKHRYHPDHNGLDNSANPQPPGISPILEEVWPITRSISMTFDAAGTGPDAPPSAGDSLITGTYTETVSGMHKRPITSRGSLQMSRVLKIGTLNPQP